VFFGGDFDREQIRSYYEKNYPGVQLRAEDLAKPDVDVPFTDLQLRVRLDSMGRKSRQERMIDFQASLGVVAGVAQVLVANPFIPAKPFVRWSARQTGIVELPDFFDWAWIEFMRALLVQNAGMPPAQSDPASLGRRHRRRLGR
jgi:hypothetical protein